MLAYKLLVALFALPLAAIAQETSAGADAAPTDAATSDAAPTDSAAPATTTSGGGGSGSSVGADINNTGNGGFGNGNWTQATFIYPSQDYYWVDGADNSASWTPAYNGSVNLVLFNSNSTVFTGNRTIAENIPAGTTEWTGSIDGFTAGNNYILTIAPVSDPGRKIAQTRGFWIRRSGTVPAVLPVNPSGVAAAGSAASASGSGAASNDTASASATSAAASEAPSAAPSAAATGAAAGLAASIFTVVAGAAVALAAY